MKLYRYHDTLYTTGTKVHLYEYNVVAETPKGYWIGMFGAKDKWVSKTCKKRFAYPTKDEAWDSFQARKTRQIEILEHQITRAKIARGSKRPE